MEIFGGALQSQVKCIACGNESNKVDEIMDISIDVLNCNSLKEAFQIFFQPQTLDGNNKYKCEKYNIQSDKKIAIYSVHPSEQATLQCLGCVKAKIPIAKSYRCTPKCFFDAWQHHRVLHERAASAVNENGNEEEDIYGRFNIQHLG